MLTTFEKILILHQLPFFADLTTDDLRRISDICDEVYFAAGERMIQAGEEGNELYILEYGRVRVFQEESGETVSELTPPAFIGEIALLSDGRRKASVEALENTNTLAISRDKFKQTIMRFPHIIFPITSTILSRILNS